MNNCFHFPPMPLDIISGKQNTSKYVHSTLVISDKRETAEADKGQRAACGGSASGHCHPPVARGTAPAATARLAFPPGLQAQDAGTLPTHFALLRWAHHCIQTAERWESTENPRLKIAILHYPSPRYNHSYLHFSTFFWSYPLMRTEAIHTKYKSVHAMLNHDFPGNI